MVCDGADCAVLSFYLLWPYIATIGLTVFFLSLGFIIRKKHKKKSNRISYLSAACFILAAISLGFMPTKYLLNKVSYQSEARKNASDLDFTVYEPAIIPNKLTARYVHDPKKHGNNFMSSYYEGIRIDQFNLDRTSKIFNIKAEAWNNPIDRNKCGPTDPEFGYMFRSCKLLTKTRSGIEVYYNEFPPRETPLPGRDSAFASIDNTGIAVEGSFDNWEEVIRIYDSLKPVDPTKINYPSSEGFIN